MTLCNRTDPHPLGECPKYAPPAALAPGAYAELAFTFEQPGGVEHFNAAVLITGVEQREGYLYVSWRNAGPRGEWYPQLGQFGAFRAYDQWAAGYATIVRVLEPAEEVLR